MYETIARLTELGQPEKHWRRRLLRLMGKPAPLLLPGAAVALRALLRQQTALIRRNMAELLPREGRTGGEQAACINSCLRGYYLHAARTLYELLAAETLLPAGKAHIRLDGEERLQAALKLGKGAILYAPHTGNFFYGYWRLSRNYPCLTVATASDPGLRPLYLCFQRLGCQGLDYDDTPPLELMRRLRSHLQKGGVVFLLGDFYRPSFPPSVLFGRDTRGPAGAAMLGLELGSPVLPARCLREKDMSHRLVLEEPILLQERFARNQRAEAMALLNRRLEEQILEEPSQWFYWFNAHERWQHDKTEGGN